MQQTRTDAERKAARREYMRQYMARYRRNPHGQEVIRRTQERSILRKAERIRARQAQERNDDKAVTDCGGN